MTLVHGERGDDMNSILTSIKKMLGIVEECEDFDTDIIIHINTALSSLTQIGVGPSDGFLITDKSSEWSNFINDNKKLEMIKTYIFLKVKNVFDPPASSTVKEIYNQNISELEWRISVEVNQEVI